MSLMISVDDFVKQYDGRPVDIDGYPKDNPYQCMDLMHTYIIECLGLPRETLSAINAKTVYKYFNYVSGHDKFNLFPKSSGIPLKGDIIFWDGTDGHVAVCLDSTPIDFHSFDQNYPVGSYCHIQYHTYISVLGWARIKGATSMNIDWKAKYTEHMKTAYNDDFHDDWNEGEVNAFFFREVAKAVDYKKRADNPIAGDVPKTAGEALILAGNLLK